MGDCSLDAFRNIVCVKTECVVLMTVLTGHADGAPESFDTCGETYWTAGGKTEELGIVEQEIANRICV